MKRWLVAAAVFVALIGPAAAEDPPATLVDRIVAVVDEDPIFDSDVERTIELGLAETREGESRRELERRVLDGLIEQRLRAHEIERYEPGPLPPGAVDRQVEEIRARFDDPQAFEARLAALGLDEAGLRHLLARQLRILAYVEERLGARVFVGLDDIRAYYEGELAAEAERAGVALPPLEEVRDEIRVILRERALNEEIEAWTRELRLEAEIVDLFDREDRPLPPVVRRFRDPNATQKLGGKDS